MRKFTLNRWNWSEKAGKWVYVTKRGGRRIYTYRIDPPEEFIKLTEELHRLNKILAKTENPDENIKIFNRMMEITKKLQEIGR
ncbi:MAG: hypothetical protein ACTSVV_19445 [Promethearchaeota archaeon]